MQTYANLGGNSNVVGYELGAGTIIVYFRDGHSYLYTDASAGPDNIAEMHALAEAGRGLNGFINRYVRKMYDSKW
ncbi:MAG TPA: hypothetical protein VM054_00215 [bacterium]|nr:hypothetical protein [bacterium]